MSDIKRIIAKLDIKGQNLVKGINMEGLRVLGNPDYFSENYYADGADEIIYHDCVASLYERKYLSKIIKNTAEKLFIPLCVGGGIKNVKDINMKYLYKFAKFLHRMKSKDPQYLAHTTIHIYENFIYNLMYTLFTFLSKPIAPVKLIFWESRECTQESKNIKKIKNFYP